MGKTSEKNAPIFVRGRGRGHLPPPKKNVSCLQISLYTMIFVLKGKKQVKKCTHICKGEGVIGFLAPKNVECLQKVFDTVIFVVNGKNK